MTSFEEALRDLINRFSVENDSDTSDRILAEYLTGCLELWAKTVRERDKWYSFNPWGKQNEL